MTDTFGLMGLTEFTEVCGLQSKRQIALYVGMMRIRF